MKVGLSTGYSENYWGSDWHNSKMIGGSERIVCELAAALAEQGHEVTVRLPYKSDPVRHRNVDWVGRDHAPLSFDVSFCFDQFGERDRSERTALVALRSDPPPHKNFDTRIYLSQHHARVMGDPGAPAVGGGVNLNDYSGTPPRLPRRVISTTSPDRCPAIFAIGRSFDFVASYRPVQGLPTTVELSRPALVELQQTAQVLIYPYDPTRESDFYSMAVLEALAAGTPCVIADGESHVEWWGDSTVVVPRPINYGQWVDEVERLLASPKRWQRYSDLGRKKAAEFDWAKVAARYLEVAS